MTTLIRAKGPRELLAYVPFRLGYRPQDSVVLVGLRAPRGRVGLVVRVDVGDLADLHDGPQVARSVVGHLVADGAERVVLAVYSEVPLRGPAATAVRERAAVEHAREACESLLGPTEAWAVSPTGWANLDCTDASCCPPAGRALQDLESSEVSAHMVLAGAGVADSREDAMRIPRATPTARRRAGRAAGAARERRERARTEDERRAWRESSLGAWRAAVTQVGATPGPTDLPGALVGRVLAGLECVPVRDAVLVSLVEATGELADETVRGGDVDDGTADAIARVVDPVLGARPDQHVVETARRVLETAAGHAVRGRAAPALTLLAFVAWWEGDGGRASQRLREALAQDPRYRLALLLASAVDAGLPPGWVRSGG
ncbi:DUF4192 domain-containing protein [Cellulosimicrobium arenosum]|uniref:DUF4192 domain-containing protein n=1 Tax=Cellulosimicrobium arenosum TaxID=2708133 RepID=A0A927G5Z7_9MICO|nr:DUF4192 domain-containing protein [Cellulosimicrobium arenosum]MBD8077582.1 DUF4192 domain-containing protein [Cellulosimicrobium arenosum]